MRAIETLRAVDQIAAEDTRHSRGLLQHYQIQKPLVALHEHNEQLQATKLIDCMRLGQKIALIADAGTPLISDPGFRLVRLAHAHNIKVIPIPGPCALIAALCASGIATDSFMFAGFLSAKAVARSKQLQALGREEKTMIFYEAPHRLVSTLLSMSECFGPTRPATLARELTKTFETIQNGSLQYLINFVGQDPQQQKGEIVLVVAGWSEEKTSYDLDLPPDTKKILQILSQELPLKQAVKLTSAITGANKKVLYRFGVQLSDQQD